MAVEVVKLLLETREANLNAEDLDGRTPLSHVSLNGHKNAVQLLLQSEEAKVDSKDCIGNTPLCLTSQDGDDGIV